MPNKSLMDALGLTSADFEPQDIIGDAVADLSMAVSENAVTTADVMDALAELSAIVSDMMEVQNG